MKLSKKDVEKIALLARIDLTAEEKKKFQKELSLILNYVQKLNEVDTDNVLPTHQVTGLENAWREDEVFACGAEQREEVIRNFPDREKNFLRVPQIFE